MVRCVSSLECIVGPMPPVIYPAVSAKPGKVRQRESQTVKPFELSSSAEPSELAGCGEREGIYWVKKEGKVGRKWAVPVGNSGWWGH